MSSCPTRNRKFKKKMAKIFKKIKKTPLLLLSKPKQVGEGRERERKKKKNRSDEFLPDS